MVVSSMIGDGPEARREALRRFLAERKLNANALARKAGITPSALYNFLGGSSKSLSHDVLVKLAAAANARVDDLIGAAPNEQPGGAHIIVRHQIGFGGQMFELSGERVLTVQRPAFLPPGAAVTAAVVPTDALMPLPSEWTVFYEEHVTDPEQLIGQLCIVRLGPDRPFPLLREIERGHEPGRYTLRFWSAATIQDAEVVAAHRVLGMVQGVPSHSRP